MNYYLKYQRPNPITGETDKIEVKINEFSDKGAVSLAELIVSGFNFEFNKARVYKGHKLIKNLFTNGN